MPCGVRAKLDWYASQACVHLVRQWRIGSQLMTLFVTGSESFVGRALVARCDELGIAVSGIDSVPSPNQRPGFVVGDIRSPELVDMVPRGSVT